MKPRDFAITSFITLEPKNLKFPPIPANSRQRGFMLLYLCTINKIKSK